MEVLFSFVIFLCVSLTVANIDTYRAGVINSHDIDGLSQYVPLIHDAGRSQVDILVLPSPEHSGSEEHYDETVKELSKAAKEAGLYIVAHLIEKSRCQSKHELVRSNLVFDRDGAIICIYRKSMNNIANCTSPSSDMTTFTTDFGVTFGLLMEEDIVLHNVDQILKNYVVTGPWSSEIPFLSAPQFSPSWAYTNNVNLVSNAGIYAGTSGLTASDRLLYADLHKSGDYEISSPPVFNPTKLRSYPDEDLSQYIIRPLDLTSTSQGYKETVCHNKFCCEFYVKTSLTGMKQEPNYGFAVFDGIRYFERNHHIGTQNCAMFACAGLYKRTCAFGSENSTNVVFENITITANFTADNTVQYPAIITTTELNNNNFKIETRIGQHKQVSAELINSSVLSFGINGRDFSRDHESYVASNIAENKAEGLTSDIYEYLYNEDVKEFFDYVWIRLRILILVVSIYILEML